MITKIIFMRGSDQIQETHEHDESKATFGPRVYGANVPVVGARAPCRKTNTVFNSSPFTGGESTDGYGDDAMLNETWDGDCINENRHCSIHINTGMTVNVFKIIT